MPSTQATPSIVHGEEEEGRGSLSSAQHNKHQINGWTRDLEQHHHYVLAATSIAGRLRGISSTVQHILQEHRMQFLLTHFIQSQVPWWGPQEVEWEGDGYRPGTVPGVRFEHEVRIQTLNSPRSSVTDEWSDS
ncbi:hypothetical protein EDD21DRAFT_357445 [Dissophora ornata]|nr:hypothetical protein EDD21DRAFT_357445 [Dissophora ornata]